MPVSLQPTDALPVIKKAGVPGDLYNQFVKFELKATLLAVGEAVGVLFQTSTGTELLFLKVSLAQVNFLKSGNMPLNIKKGLSDAFTDALMTVINTYLEGGHATKPKPVSPPMSFKGPSQKKGGFATISTPGKPKDPTNVPVINVPAPDSAAVASAIKAASSKPQPIVLEVASGFKPCSAEEMVTLPKVPLAEATRMYQPVSSTEPTSRYHLVAANKNLKVAARWLNDTLSVRLEGPLLPSIANQLKEVGLDNTSAHHASIHIKCMSQVMAAKALGAVLTGLGLPFDTPVPVFPMLVGKGA